MANLATEPKVWGPWKTWQQNNPKGGIHGKTCNRTTQGVGSMANLATEPKGPWVDGKPGNNTKGGVGGKPGNRQTERVLSKNIVFGLRFRGAWGTV